MRSGSHRILLMLALSIYTGMTWAQSEDPFSIRVESNLVLVHVEVYDKERMYAYSVANMRCRKANDAMFNHLSPSEPYLPRPCYEFAINGLRAGDFHVFEDGIEQKIQSSKIEPWSGITVRDSLGIHGEWSHTPQGRWSDIDMRAIGSAGDRSRFYQIAYVPAKPEKGRCHQLRVTVDRPNAAVFARDHYCYIERPLADPLQGTKFGKQMEHDLDSDRRGKIPLSLAASFFYEGPQTARVNLVVQFPWDHLKHEWKRLDFKAMVGVLGVIYEGRNTAARFTDLACCTSESPAFLFSTNPDAYSYPQDLGYDARERFDPIILPSRYETQIELPAGKEYDLRVVLSDGKKFGRASTRLKIDSYDGKQIAMSSVALCRRFRDPRAAAKEDAAANLAPRYVPLVSGNVQVTPSAEMTFKRGEELIAYFEVYEPLLAQQANIELKVRRRIVEAKTGNLKVDFPPLDAAPYERPGSTTIPIGDGLIFKSLPKGKYRLEVQATDSAGRSTPWRTATFTLE